MAEYVFSSNNGGRYIHDSLWESYINTKIGCEEKLAKALMEEKIITESAYSNIVAVQEAKLSDKVKAKWKRFIAFIKGVVARFMESITNILYDEKDYLEKYKEIILKRKPKEDMEYSYTGNYKRGIERLTSTTLPIFDYAKYRDELNAEDNTALIEKIARDSGASDFKYVDGETLAEQYKSYYLDYDAGQQQGKFSDLNMTDLYNFCYNFNKVKGIVDKDMARLDASTRAIESAINKELNSNTTTNTASKTTDDKANGTDQNTSGNTGSKEESAVFFEAEEGNKDKPEGLKITNSGESTDATSKMGSTTDASSEDKKVASSTGAAAAETMNKNTDDITKAADRWIEVCQPLITAKMTACQQIAKDYMAIIRAHVRSYGGQDLKKDKSGAKAPDKASRYSKNNEVSQAQRDADNAEREANKATEDANKK